jgi:hypothetical protein
VENAANLSEIFSSELATARETVASGVEVRFAPAPGVELVEAAGYPIERDGQGAYVLRPGTLFAGQDRRIWTTLRVPAGADSERAKKLLEKAEQICLIANSLNAERHLEASVVTG